MKKKTQSAIFILLGFLPLTVLTSCFPQRNRTDMGSLGNELFYVQKITKPENLDPITPQYKEGLTSSFILNLKTCLKDSFNKDVSIPETMFFVEYETNLSDSGELIPTQIKTEEAPSDGQGCIEWQEEYKFRFVNNPVWIGLKRTIRTKGNAYAGDPVSVTLAVNPWLHESDRGYPPILDMRYSKDHRILKGKYEEDGLAFLSARSKKEFPQLWVPDIDIHVETDPQKATKDKDHPLDKAYRLRKEREKAITDQCKTPYETCMKKYKTDDTVCRELPDFVSRSQCLHQQRGPLQKCIQVQKACLKRFRDTHSEQIKQLLEPYRTECSPDNPDNCYKRFLDVRVMIPLKFRRHNVNGRRFITENLSGGKYDVNIQLVVNSPGRNSFYRMHEEKNENGEKVCHDKTLGFREGESQQTQHLLLRCTLKIPFYKSKARYKAFLEVKPNKDSDLPFKAFQGIYRLSEDFIKNPKKDKLDIDNDIDTHYKEILNTEQEINLFQDIEVKDIMSTQEVDYTGFNVPQLEDSGKGDYRYANIHTPEDCNQHDNGVTRTVVFAGEVCLDDILEDNYPRTNFRVFIEKPDEDGNYFTEEIFPIDDTKRSFYETKVNGCMELTVSLFNKIYMRQRYVRVKIHFLSEELNIYARAEPALNPWQKQFQAYVDATEISDDDKVRFNVKGVEEPRLIINEFKSVNMFPSYGLDKLLNIHLYHRLYFLFRAFIQRLGDVAHGSFAASREFMRDGYYLVRLLLLRNPQETMHTNRVYHLEQIDSRQKSLQNENIDFEEYKNAEYITHSDMLVKAEANFINLYTPLFITTKQLYYVSSRNILSIEMFPTDPSKYVYHDVKGDEGCELDVEATRWFPYFDHDLKNNAFLGAFNLSELTNWNILRPVEKFSSDEVILKSEIGRQYKLFDLREDDQEDNDPKSYPYFNQYPQLQANPHLHTPKESEPLLCTNPSNDESLPIEAFSKATFKNAQQLIDYMQSKDYEYWVPDEFSLPDTEEIETANQCLQEGSTQYTERHEEVLYKEVQNKIDSIPGEDPLPAFADQNALRIIELSGEEGDQFIEDIQTSLMAVETESQRIQTEKPLLKMQSNISKVFLLIPDDLKTSVTIGETYKDPDTGVEYEHENDKFYLEAQIMEKCQNQGKPSIEDLESKAEICDYFVRTLPKDYQVPSTRRLNSWGFDNPEEFLGHIRTCGLEDNIRGLYTRSVKNMLNQWQAIRQQANGTSAHEYLHLPTSQCSYNIIENYVFDMVRELENVEYQGNSETILEQEETIQRMLRNIDSITDFKKSSWANLDKGKVQEIINDRLIYKTQIDKVFSFSQSLCHFWFDSFLPKYLESEQILSAFTNYITRFDYYKVLESESYKDRHEILDIIDQFTDLIGMHGEGEFYSCHKQYKQCILSDHCQLRTINLTDSKIGYCSKHLNQEQESCTQLVKEECQKDSDFPFCPSQKECDEDPDSPLCPSYKEQAKFYHAFKRNCNEAAYGFCQINSEHQFCRKFSSRCLSNFRSCMKNENMAEIFHPHNILNPNLNDENNPLLATCLKDPYQFFTFENKLVIYELSDEDPIYVGGLLRNFSINENFSFGDTISWSGSHNHNISGSLQFDASASFGLLTKLKFKRRGNLMNDDLSGAQQQGQTDWARVGGGLQLRLGESMSSDTSNTSRRSADARIANALFLTMGNAKIKVNVKDFKKCLVIKPHPNAFFAHNQEGWFARKEEVWATTVLNHDLKKIFITRPGLILCKPLETNQSEPILEDYYYISQAADTRTVKFLNISDLANRPFINVLRGRKEFVKYYHMMRVVSEGDNGDLFQNGNLFKPTENLFTNYPFSIEEGQSLSLAIREFKETGFHQGIYDYAERADRQLIPILREGEEIDSPFMNTLRSNVHLFGHPVRPEDTNIPHGYSTMQ